MFTFGCFAGNLDFFSDKFEVLTLVTMKSAIFLDVAVYSPILSSPLFHKNIVPPSSMLCLLFGPEHRGSMFLWNSDEVLPDYTVLHLRRWYSLEDEIIIKTKK
jgi:hypothetical protein